MATSKKGSCSPKAQPRVGQRGDSKPRQGGGDRRGGGRGRGRRAFAIALTLGLLTSSAFAQSYVFEESAVKDSNEKMIVKEYTQTITEKFKISDLEQQVTMYENEIANLQECVSELETKISEAKVALKITE